MMMKEKLFSVLRGRFLVNDNAFKNWRMIFFLSGLALVMIASSHSADRKVYRIAALNDQVKELRSEFVDLRARLMKIKMESAVVKKLKVRNFEIGQTPPEKIIVIEK
jgi:hypothetical protein